MLLVVLSQIIDDKSVCCVQVLADMDDSMVAVLPPALATEANMLRRELEDRHRRLMQERLFTQGGGGLSALLRQSGMFLSFRL